MKPLSFFFSALLAVMLLAAPQPSEAFFFSFGFSGGSYWHPGYYNYYGWHNPYYYGGYYGSPYYYGTPYYAYHYPYWSVPAYRNTALVAAPTEKLGPEVAGK